MGKTGLWELRGAKKGPGCSAVPHRGQEQSKHGESRQGAETAGPGPGEASAR